MYFMIGASYAIPEGVYYVIWSLPGDLLFSTYWLLVFFWADAYHHAHKMSNNTEQARKLRIIVLIACNVLLYLIQLAVFIIGIFDPRRFIVGQPYFFSCIAILSVLVFVVYGSLLICRMRKSPIQSSLRRAKIRKV